MNVLLFIALGFIALLIVGGVILVRRFNNRLRNSGTRALATIVRMDGIHGTMNDEAPYMNLTLEWTLSDGNIHTEQIGKKCDLANLPQQGDRLPIFYAPGNPTLYAFADNRVLRHDEMEGAGK